MSGIQRIATLSGGVFILLGLLGFTPAGMGVMHMEAGAPSLLLGLFPVNAVHNLVHVAIGVWGSVAGRSRTHAVVYALGSGSGYLLLGLGGLIADTLLGIVPIGGHDVALHLSVAAVLVGSGVRALWSGASRDGAISARREAA